jgi:hypothetical protein
MAVIPLIEKAINFETELGVVATARRAYAAFEFSDRNGNTFQRYAAVDSGAPFSVLPFSLWHDKNIPWQPLGSQFLRDQKPNPTALTWFGVPCQFGQAHVFLLHRPPGIRSKLLSLRAKFPVARVAAPAEKEAILGQSFLVENLITQTTRGGVTGLDGVFLVD